MNAHARTAHLENFIDDLRILAIRLSRVDNASKEPHILECLGRCAHALDELIGDALVVVALSRASEDMENQRVILEEMLKLSVETLTSADFKYDPKTNTTAVNTRKAPLKFNLNGQTLSSSDSDKA